MEPLTNILEGALARLRSEEQTLLDHGLHPKIMAAPSCGGPCSCTPKFQLHVPESEGQQARTILQDRWNSQLDDRALRLANMVVDLNAAEITCPGCETTFPSGPAECPECGLFLGTAE